MISTIRRISILSFVVALFCTLAVMIATMFAGQVNAAELSGSLSSGGDNLHQVRLELKLLDQKTKLIGDAIISEDSIKPYTIVETVFKTRARAFGGDVYLPTYREDIVFEPVIMFPEEGSNAVIPGTPSIHLGRTLPMKEGKYILHEYEEVDITITIPMKVLSKTIPPRLIFKTKLNTVLWYPTVYQNGLHDPGISAETGERLIQIPLINANSVPMQVTRLDWQTEPVVLLRGGKTYSAIKKDIKQNNSANVFTILKRSFSGQIK